jgi:hypothetical protein
LRTPGNKEFESNIEIDNCIDTTAQQALFGQALLIKQLHGQVGFVG